MAITLNAPVTGETIALGTAYIGSSAEYLILDARRIWIGGFLDGTGLVAGTAKVLWGGGASVQLPIPADNLLILEVGGGLCFPPVFIDVKAAFGTPTLVLIAV